LFFWGSFFLYVSYCHCLMLQCSYSEVLIHTSGISFLSDNLHCIFSQDYGI
jgi:hypothetical protein